jgi:hypothetical protein
MSRVTKDSFALLIGEGEETAVGELAAVEFVGGVRAVELVGFFGEAVGEGDVVAASMGERIATEKSSAAIVR